MKYGVLFSSANNGSDADVRIGFVAPLTIDSNRPVFAGDSLSLVRVTSVQDHQRWEVSAGLSPGNGDASALMIAAIHGHHSDVYIRMPQVADLNTTPQTSLVKTTGVSGAGSEIIYTNVDLVPGEFINIGNDPKVYMVVEGNGTKKVFPKLRQAVANDATVKTSGKVTMVAKIDSNKVLGISFSDGILSNPGEYRFIEALK